MKKIYIIFTLALLLATALFAATEQWSVDGKEMIMQVVADGKGGCAFICSETNSVKTIVWLDKSGKSIYESTVSNAVIITCSNKQLVYKDKLSGPKIIQIDVKGRKKEFSKSESDAYVSLMHSVSYPSEMADKKGFFAVKITMASRQALVRFSNK